MKQIKDFWNKYKYALIVIIQGLVFYLLLKNILFLWVGLGISALCFLFPAVLRILSKFEEFVSKQIAKLINLVLLSFVYLFFILPIGLIKKFVKSNKSEGFKEYNHTYSMKDFTNPW